MQSVSKKVDVAREKSKFTDEGVVVEAGQLVCSPPRLLEPVIGQATGLLALYRLYEPRATS
jgi:hypothetical protein